MKRIVLTFLSLCFTVLTFTQPNNLHPAEPELIEVTGGTFRMGCRDYEGFPWEYPVHKVTINSFKIAKYEVTQKQWVAIMESNPSHFKGDNLPVENVSWLDVQKFISKLNEITGKDYRLPTESEWEYAARGGKKSKNYKYSGGNKIDEVGWYIENSDGTTHPVGTKKPNELGIYDMCGNVAEWCNDLYEDYFGAAISTQEALGLLQDDKIYPVLRGAKWSSEPQFCRVSFRSRTPQDFISDALGFRLVLP
jgi:formylglycine-generating enzyme required for sulfatase activity